MSRLPSTVTIGNREVQVPVTLIDRLVNWRDPVRGAERWQARARMAIAGGYNAADRTRRVNQKGWRRELDAKSAIIPDLSTLREESQEMERNNAIASGALQLNVTKVVGQGLHPKAQVDRVTLGLSDEVADAWERAAEREYRLATETVEIDAERSMAMDQLQAMYFLRVLADGDLLVNLPRFSRPGSPYKLKLQAIDAARLCNPEKQRDSEQLCGGIAFDANGAPEVYHVCTRHPGSFRLAKPGEQQLHWKQLNAFDSKGNPLVLHLFDKKRPGQPRGVPYLAPVIELIKQLGRYTDSEVMAALVSSYLTVIITNDDPQPDGTPLGPAPTQANPDADQSAQVDPTGIELGHGSVVELTGNKTVNTVSDGRNNHAFDPFVQAIMRQIGMALEIPYEVLVRHFTASYSAARGALEEALDYFLRRRTWLISSLCRPVYNAIIAEAVAAGRLAAPGFFADASIRKAWSGAIWQGDAPSSLDPVKEIEAAERRVALHLTTRSEERSKLVGGDWESTLPQIKREYTAIVEAGLDPNPKQSAAAQAKPPGDQNAPA